MSILSFMPATATIPSNSSGRRFAGFGFPHLSSTSLRMAPFLDHKITSLTVANCNRNPESYPTVELNAAVRLAEKHIPLVPHWKFCYMIIRKVFVYGAFLIHRLDPDLRDAVCILSLVCIAIDTIEDDASMDSKVKVPILMAFHSHMYNRGWHFACGTKDFRVLMNKFHHVSTSFLELGSSYQKAIEDVSMTMGAGMAKFLYKEVETIEDYDEYCHYVAGVIGIGFSKLIHASGIEDLPPVTFFHSISVFFQKADIIQDYLEDTSEMSRMFWPREIWSKYVDKSEDLKFEKNSIKAVHCLNEMITNALIHTDDCLQYISAVQHPTIFQSCAMAQIVTIGTLASCYNNIQVFRGVENMRFDLAPKAVDGSKTISDFYRVFYDFTCVLKSKIDDSDPNATKTKERVEATLNALQELRNLKVN